MLLEYVSVLCESFAFFADINYRRGRKGERRARKEMTRTDLLHQTTGDARHGGRSVTSATGGIKRVKDISET